MWQFYEVLILQKILLATNGLKSATLSRFLFDRLNMVEFS